MENINCLICFKPLLNKISLSYLLSFNSCVCKECKAKFKLINKKEIINNIEVTFLYEYNSFAKELVYKYKGCYDIVLKDVFLDGFKEKLFLKYKDYTIVFPPSYDKENKERGFIHILEITKTLHIKYEDLFVKTSKYKQSSMEYKKRNEISKYIKLKSNKKITNKKYLILDDIYTSGNTLRTIIKLLVKNKVSKEKIKALIIFKVPNNY